MKSPRRNRLATAVHLSLLLALPGLAAAQDAAPQPAAKTLDTLTVTGTRIKSAEVAGQVPVQVLTREDIDRTGLTSLGDLVQELTGAGSALNTKFNSSGNFGFPPDGGGVGAGAAKVDLRHLGAKARAGAGRRHPLGQRVVGVRRGRGRPQHHPAGDRRAHRSAAGRRFVDLRLRRDRRRGQHHHPPELRRRELDTALRRSTTRATATPRISACRGARAATAHLFLGVELFEQDSVFVGRPRTVAAAGARHRPGLRQSRHSAGPLHLPRPHAAIVTA